MRLYFPSVEFIDTSAKLIKQSVIDNDGLKLSLNKVRDAVSRAYGYSNYTDLRANGLSDTPTIEPSHLEPGSEPEERLFREISALCAERASGRGGRAGESFELGHDLARVERMLRVPQYILFYDRPSTVIAGAIAAHLAELKIYGQLGEDLFGQFLGSATDYFNSLGLDGMLQLLITSGGRLRLTTFSKTLQFRHGELERLESYSSMEDVLLAADDPPVPFLDSYQKGYLVEFPNISWEEILEELEPSERAAAQASTEKLLIDRIPASAYRRLFVSRLSDDLALLDTLVEEGEPWAFVILYLRLIDLLSQAGVWSEADRESIRESWAHPDRLPPAEDFLFLYNVLAVFATNHEPLVTILNYGPDTYRDRQTNRVLSPTLAQTESFLRRAVEYASAADAEASTGGIEEEEPLDLGGDPVRAWLFLDDYTELTCVITGIEIEQDRAVLVAKLYAQAEGLAALELADRIARLPPQMKRQDLCIRARHEGTDLSMDFEVEFLRSPMECYENREINMVGERRR